MKSKGVLIMTSTRINSVKHPDLPMAQRLLELPLPRNLQPLPELDDEQRWAYVGQGMPVPVDCENIYCLPGYPWEVSHCLSGDPNIHYCVQVPVNSEFRMLVEQLVAEYPDFELKDIMWSAAFERATARHEELLELDEEAHLKFLMDECNWTFEEVLEQVRAQKEVLEQVRAQKEEA